jgi:thioredoxin 1
MIYYKIKNKNNYKFITNLLYKLNLVCYNKIEKLKNKLNFKEIYIMSKPIYVTDADFKEVVLTSEKPILVDFYADWCGPCKMIAPILEEVAKELGETATIAKLNVDENQATARDFMVMSIPTMIIFKNGQNVEKLVGLRSANALLESIKKHI